MLTDTTISDLIAKLNCLDPVPGAGGGETGYRPLDAGEVAAATLVACGEAAIPALIKATKSDQWEVRYLCADVLGIIGSETGVPALVGLLRDANRRVQQSAMLALLGDSGMDLAASGHVAALSAFMGYCRRSARFDILRLLARHGTAEIQFQANTLLKQKRVSAQQIVLDAALSYAEKKRALLELKVDENWVCDQIQKTGTEQERTSAAQFLQYCELVRGGSAPPTPVGHLVIAAAYSPPVTPVEQLLLSSDNPETGAAPVVSSAAKPGRRLRLPFIVDMLPARFQGTPPPSAPKPAPLLEVPAPSLETYATRTHARGWLSAVAGMEMVLIPAGAFLMGDADQSDNPRRTISLDAYWISRHPVTVKQYRAFCSATGHALPEAPGWGWKEDHPIVKVSWDDAQAFCNWVGMELPTEAQWEKAARGTDGRKYPWGDEWDASKCQCSKKDWGDAGGTAPVGSHPLGASPYGVLDMAGNVREWCEDKNDAASGYRVLRGGSFGHPLATAMNAVSCGPTADRP